MMKRAFGLAFNTMSADSRKTSIPFCRLSRPTRQITGASGGRSKRARTAHLADLQHLVGRAFLDRDIDSAGRRQVECRQGRGHVEGNRVCAREHGERIRPDLVRHVAIGRNPIRANHDRIDLATRHHGAGRPVRDQRKRNPLACQLPGGEARALQERPRLGGDDTLQLARIRGRSNDTECSPVAPGGQSTRIAVREEARAGLDQGRPVLPDGEAALDVLVSDALRQLPRGGSDPIRGLSGTQPGGHVQAHAIECPLQIDRRGTRSSQTRAGPLESLAERLVGISAQLDRHAHRCGHTDGGCAAHDHILDRTRDLLGGLQIEVDLVRWQCSLIEEHDGVLGQAHRAKGDAQCLLRSSGGKQRTSILTSVPARRR